MCEYFTYTYVCITLTYINPCVSQNHARTQILKQKLICNREKKKKSVFQETDVENFASMNQTHTNENNKKNKVMGIEVEDANLMRRRSLPFGDFCFQQFLVFFFVWFGFFTYRPAPLLNFQRKKNPLTL